MNQILDYAETGHKYPFKEIPSDKIVSLFEKII